MTIDWAAIWEIHVPHYKNGYAEIPLTQNKTLRLKPGPGFGDLSHPTTSLVLDLLKPIVKDRVVVDIGSGSGILSIAAALLGAKAVYPFEIDPEAIAHGRENFALNHLDFPMNQVPDSFDLVCINMISSEQQIALEEYPFLQQHPHQFITSGLLVKEKKRYLQMMKGYTLIAEQRSKEWLSLLLNFSISSS